MFDEGKKGNIICDTRCYCEYEYVMDKYAKPNLRFKKLYSRTGTHLHRGWYETCTRVPVITYEKCFENS